MEPVFADLGIPWKTSRRSLTVAVPGATMQDFVLNSHPVMIAADTRGFMELLQANEAGGIRRAVYFLTHPNALRVGLAARTNPTCHLDLSYWSTTRTCAALDAPSSTSSGRAQRCAARCLPR